MLAHVRWERRLPGSVWSAAVFTALDFERSDATKASSRIQSGENRRTPNRRASGYGVGVEVGIGVGVAVGRTVGRSRTITVPFIQGYGTQK